MIRAVSKLTFTALLGAALMGCSSDARPNDSKPASHAQTQEKIPAADSRIITFGTNADCIRKDAGDKVALTLTDGTKLSLPRSWLTFVKYNSNGKTFYQKSNAVTNVQRLQFSMPIDTNDAACSKNVPTVIYAIDTQVDYAGEGNVGAFDTMYTPPYTLQSIPNELLIETFQELAVPHRDFGPYRIYDAPQKDEGAANSILGKKLHDELSKRYKIRSRYTVGQVRDHQAIRVGGNAYYLGISEYPGIIVDSTSDKLLGYYEHSQIGWHAGGNMIKLSLPISSKYAAIIDVESDQEHIDNWTAGFLKQRPEWKGVLTPSIDTLKVQYDINAIMNALNDNTDINL